MALKKLYPLVQNCMLSIVHRSSDTIYRSDYNRDTYFVMFDVKCPCGDSHLFTQAYCDSSGIVSDYDLCILQSFHRLFAHIEHKIRIRGDKKHLDLFIDMVGKDVALEMLDKWAKQNLVVNNLLQEYISTLRKER